MFLIKTYRFVLTQLVATMARAADQKAAKAEAARKAIAALEYENRACLFESAKLKVEATRLKALLG